MFDELKALYHTAIEENADVRTKHWFLVQSPWPPLCILVVYTIFCVKSQTLMKNIPRLELRGVLIIYNFSLVALSAYMTFEFFMSSYLAGYSLLCQPVDYSTTPLAMRMANVCWWYFFSKYIELLDTVFFVLRKKFNQVSFLHIFHHSTMLINWWLGVKYVAGGQSFFIGLVNSFVHIIMYTYYGLSCLGPQIRQYLWWKKYLTKLQLIQFLAIFLHCSYSLYVGCDFPQWLNIIVMAYMIFLIVLFANFYIQSYLNRKRQKRE